MAGHDFEIDTFVVNAWERAAMEARTASSGGIAGMPKVTWSDLTKHRPNAYLLVASLPQRDVLYNDRRHLNLLTRLISRVAKEKYALASHRQGSALEIHCLFESEEDARKVGHRLGARNPSPIRLG